MLNIAVLVSGGGTNLQALLDAQARGGIHGGKIACVISSRPDAYALTRAQNAGVPTEIAVRRSFPDADAYEDALLGLFDRYRIDLIVLAGFMTIIGARIIRRYENKIINIHPSLIPSFCGKGFYGLKVHEAALSYGVKVTGATVHFVSADVDGGAIVMQRPVPVLDGDTPETLQERVLETEHQILPLCVKLLCEGKIEKRGRQVFVHD